VTSGSMVFIPSFIKTHGHSHTIIPSYIIREENRIKTDKHMTTWLINTRTEKIYGYMLDNIKKFLD
jgi:hypothetical protein